jgi:hypothetical protein
MIKNVLLVENGLVDTSLPCGMLLAEKSPAVELTAIAMVEAGKHPGIVDVSVARAELLRQAHFR